MDKEIIEKLRNTPVMPDRFLRLIEKQGMMTGSYVFGGYVEGSDIDYILPPNFILSFQQILDIGGCYPGGSYSNDVWRCIYVKTSRGILNLLFFWNEENYQTYKKATLIMVDILKNKEIKEAIKIKKNRV